MSWWKTAPAGTKVACISKGNGRKPKCWPSAVWNRLVIGGVYTVEYVAAPRISSPCPAFVFLTEFGPRYELDVRGFRPVEPAGKKADRGLAALKDGIKTVREREPA